MTEETPPKLTPRQALVCGLVSNGLSAKEIAAELGLSPRTVEAYREEIYKKYGVRNAVELVRKTIREG